MPCTLPIPPVGIAPSPTTAQPPPLPSSAAVTGNAVMQGGGTASYTHQYPPLPPAGMYPTSGN